MKKKIISSAIVFVLMVSLFAIPTSSIAYEKATATDAEQSIESINSPGYSNGLENSIENAAEIQLSAYSFKYTGSEIRPTVNVKNKETAEPLEEGTDYVLEYENNIEAGTASVKILGMNMYTGETSEEFKIEPVGISDCKISLSKYGYAYERKYQKPVPIVIYGGKTLKAGTDYTLTYSNNYYPGTGKVVIIGKGNYKEAVTKTFTIGSTTGLILKARGTNSLKIGWNRQSNVTGYRVYTYSFAKKQWRLVKTLKGSRNNVYTIQNLLSGRGNWIRVRAYVKTSSGKYYYGAYSKILKTQTAPGRVVLKSFYSTPTLYATVKWGKKYSNGYQVKLSRYSNFSNASTYNIKSSSTLLKRMGKLRNNRTYYVKVRAYRTYNGKTVYGSWSKYKKVKTDGTGWVYGDGKKYYYVNGSKLTGNRTVGGKKYYFRTDTGALSGVTFTMWSKVRNRTSGTRYLVATSRDLNVTCVYSGSKGNWNLKYYWKCTTGAAGTRTPAGVFSTPTTKPKLRYMGQTDSYTCWYATRFYKRCYYHSVLYNYMSHTSIQDGRLGSSLSHGCVRLAKGNAKWLYDNIKPGTKVIIY